MSGKVVSLSEVKKESGANVVSILEQESSLLTVTIRQLTTSPRLALSRTCSRAWANGHHPFSLLGQLENAKASFMEANLE